MRWSGPHGDVRRLARSSPPYQESCPWKGHQVTASSEIPCRVRELPCMGVTPCLYPAHNGEALPGRLVARTRPWPAGNAVGSPLPSNGYGPVTTVPRKGTAPGAVTAPL